MKISVITVCLNSAKTIEQTIQSVIGQDDTDFEYIIIDGGSEDGTLDIIEKYRKNITILISELDNGIYDAMNKGITLASGEIIGIINSDDWYEPAAIERVVDCFEKTGAQAVYGEMWLIDQNGEREYHTWNSTFPPHPSTFIKREIYQKYGMFDTRYHIAADRDLLLRFMTAGIKFEHINAVIANFRRTGISNTRILECAEETYKIDLKYFGRCSECLNRNAIEEKYEREKLLYISQTHPRIIREILSAKGFGSDGAAIFGAGSCGKEFLKILEMCSVPIRLFTDNDMSKWGLEYHGIKIYSPETLRNFSGHVIVTVSRFQENICGQLQNYGNPVLNWSCLGEIRKRIIRAFDSYK